MPKPTRILMPHSKPASSQSNPEMASTRGYLAEIDAPQSLHRARKISHDSTGTLSYQRIALPHEGQCELGATIDSPRGTRQIITFPMLPKRRPNSPTESKKNHSGTTITHPPHQSSASVPRLPRRLLNRKQNRKEPVAMTPPALSGRSTRVELRSARDPHTKPQHQCLRQPCRYHSRCSSGCLTGTLAQS